VLRITPNDEIAFITAIDERRNYIIRKASNLSKQSHILAANIDRAPVVAPGVAHQAEDASDHPCTRCRMSGIMTARPTCEAIALSLARIAEGMPRRE